MKEINVASLLLAVNIQLPDSHVATVTLFSYITTSITTLWRDGDGFPRSLPPSFSCCPQSCADCLTPTLHSSVLTSHTLSAFPVFFHLLHTPPSLLHVIKYYVSWTSHKSLIGLCPLYVSASLCRSCKCVLFLFTFSFHPPIPMMLWAFSQY